MKSIVEVDIDVPQARVAALFGNPENTPQWMDDVDRYEAISGEPGMPGSKYRLVPRKGTMVFVATVLPSRLPDEFRLELQASGVVVSVTSRLVALSPSRTRLTSEEVFRFKGLFRTVFGLLARAAIRSAHRRHIAAFKRFAESHG
jgi:hypothetical protein